MSQNYQWRRKFVEVVEEVFRDLNFDPPPMTHDADASLVMELDVDGTTYEVVHNPRTNAACCLVEARLGPIQSEHAAMVLNRLLTENFTLSRLYHGCFAADIKDDTVLFNFSLALEGLRGTTLLQAMRETAVLAIDWRMLLSGLETEPRPSMQNISAALA